ncbi:MAG: hypothetical protein F2825_03970 [Actinobacteria bacterium]|uniref:Unannotated protein n=1 Tax=freshwater metagenome TaxID=449393 RepID=A0A6J7GRC9_9ZZZZ|nr:hypothetical protein [Actinomycetota bacterium]
MSRLVAFFEDKPVDLKGRLELQQEPLVTALDRVSSTGALRSSLVYVERLGETGPFLVPFGEYDEWSLRDRYNEAIRIMNTLGASEIACETWGQVASQRRISIRFRGKGPQVTQQRIQNGGYDFKHHGAGSSPRDPRPLRWPDEPGFAAAVSSVLDNGATQVTINIRSTRTHAVDGELGVQLKKVGFDLGGGNAREEATSLFIQASFPTTRKWR